MTYILTAWCFFWVGSVAFGIPTMLEDERIGKGKIALVVACIVYILFAPIAPFTAVYRIVKGK